MTNQKITDKCPVCDCFNWKVISVALIIVTSILAINWYFNYFPSPQSYDEVRVASYYQGYSWNETDFYESVNAETFQINLKWFYGFNETWVLTHYPYNLVALNNADEVIDFEYATHDNTSWYYNYTAFSFITTGIGEGELIFERFVNNVYQDNYKVKLVVVGDILWE